MNDIDSTRIRTVLEAENDEVQHLLSVGDAVALGLFRCPIEHPRFEAGHVSLDHIVFPRGQIKLYRGTGVEISTPARANVYHADEQYSREPISREGDEANWIAISRNYLEDIVGSIAPALLDKYGGERLFASPSLPISDGMLLAVRILFARLERGEYIDPIALDAYVGELVERLFVEARIGVNADSTPVKASVRARQRRAISHACEFIAAHFSGALSLGEIASAAGLSRSALCAAFHRETGFSVAEYVERLRVQTAMIWIEQGEVVFSEIATHLGYTSHSHFSARFRAHFKISPRMYKELRKTPIPHLPLFDDSNLWVGNG